MAKVTYPEDMSPELAARLYGSVEVPWSSKTFEYDEDRSECQFWLNESSAHGVFPPLVNVIRRGEDAGDDVRVFQWANGLLYEQET